MLRRISRQLSVISRQRVGSRWFSVGSSQRVGNKRLSSKHCQPSTVYRLLLNLIALHSLLIASPSTGLTQSLPSFFTDSDLATLEQLVLIAEVNDLQILEYQAELGVNETSFGFTGRLGEALSVNAGTSVRGSYYGQAELSYNLSVSLDVMELLSGDDASGVIEQRIATAKLNTRVRVVEAFVAYKISLINAETRARAVEASQARYEVAVTRVQAGESILSSQINAQSDLANAGLSLYSANGDVIIALEKLAAVVGVSPFDMSVLLRLSDGQ